MRLRGRALRGKWTFDIRELFTTQGEKKNFVKRNIITFQSDENERAKSLFEMKIFCSFFFNFVHSENRREAEGRINL